MRLAGTADEGVLMDICARNMGRHELAFYGGLRMWDDGRMHDAQTYTVTQHEASH